jgi:hypothetical protein
MSSTRGVPLGDQRPRVFCRPSESVGSAGREAVDLARMAGLHLDPWQEFVLEHSLAEKANGLWAAFTVGLEVPRQNGKDGILEARSLAGLFLLGEQLIIHSAHQFDTSLEAFRRLLFLVEENPEFMKRVKPKGVKKSHGEEGIELRSGQRIRYRTRTSGGGRGFSGDCVFLNEAMILSTASQGALLPTLSARPNPQVWYVGSAVDQAVHEHGEVFARVRSQAMEAEEQDGIAYFGWSPAFDSPDEVTHEAASDPKVWAQSNPALGIRIAPEHIALELQSMDPRTFAVERLGVGDWPDLTLNQGRVIQIGAWDALTDLESSIDWTLRFAFDVSPDRSRAAIAAVGRREDDLVHVEVVDHRKGTGWVAPRLAQLVEENDVAAPVRCDAAGPASSLVTAIEELEVDVDAVTAREHADACGQLYDLVYPQGVDGGEGLLRHLGTPELRAAIRGAEKRPLGEAWAWARSKSTVDICPLVAVTLAVGSIESERYAEEIAAEVFG